MLFSHTEGGAEDKEITSNELIMMLFSHTEGRAEDTGRSSSKLIMILFSHIEGRAENKGLNTEKALWTKGRRGIPQSHILYKLRINRGLK